MPFVLRHCCEKVFLRSDLMIKEHDAPIQYIAEQQFNILHRIDMRTDHNPRTPRPVSHVTSEDLVSIIIGPDTAVKLDGLLSFVTQLREQIVWIAFTVLCVHPRPGGQLWWEVDGR